MKKKLLSVICFLLSLGIQAQENKTIIVSTDNGPGASGKFMPDWESLAKHNTEPEWFKDAKLGIYFHWGIYSVPAYDSEWYPAWMYYSNLKKGQWGASVHDYHVKTYGAEFN